MDDPVFWNECSRAIYRAIYDEFKDRLGIYSIAGLYGNYHMTTWCLGDAPLIMSKGHQDHEGKVSEKPEDWFYFIATARYLEPPCRN